MRISFLLDHAYGVGGAIRSTFSTAGALADAGHEVTVLSAKRLRGTPSFPLHPRVRLQPLTDLRHVDRLTGDDRQLHRRPASAMPVSDAVHTSYTGLIEQRIAAALSTSDAQVHIGTRPGLNALVARFAPTDRIRIGMAHTTFSYYSPPGLADELDALSQLDGLITVATGDVAVWQRHLAGTGTRVTGIPNCVGPGRLPPASLDSRTIVAVGRLTGVKQFHLLLRAFAIVSDKCPDWNLRIYGRGPARDSLRELITELGLYNRAFLMGAVTPIEPEWAKAHIAAVTSRLESFHIGLVEAQQLGVPVVAMACERGPLDIITPDVDGVLTPPNDVEAFAAGLLTVIDDPRFAAAIGNRARQTATRFHPTEIAAQYDRFLTELHRRRHPATGRWRPRWPRRPRTTTPPRPDTVDCFVGTDTGFLELTAVGRRPARLCLRQVDGGNTIALDCTNGTARVPLTTALPEATYLVHLDDDADPVTAGTLDLRGLRGRTDLTGHRVCHLVPFPDADGHLSIRSWRRAGHAEAGDLIVSDGTVTVTGRLYGKYPTGARWHGLARGRGDDGPPLRVDAEVSATGGFAFTMSADTLVSHTTGPGIADLFLAPVGAGAPLRLMRVLDDLACRKSVFVYPTAQCRRGGAQPYYTDHNGLSVRVTVPDQVHPSTSHRSGK